MSDKDPGFGIAKKMPFRRKVTHVRWESGLESPATRNRTRDHLIPAMFYSQMLCQLSYSRLSLASPSVERQSRR